MPRWVNKWQVESSSGDKFYTVSEADDGTFGCNCPVWKFRRQVCKHIVAIQAQLGRTRTSQARVNTPLQPPLADTVPCRVCGMATTMTGTGLCDGCWEQQRAHGYASALARQAKRRKPMEPMKPEPEKDVIRKLILDD